MDDADAAQIECLTNADPFTPKDNSVADVDLSSFFQASQTVRHYFVLSSFHLKVPSQFDFFTTLI